MKLTDERRTHWFWMDNEAIDILCSQFGPHVFATYAALARMANAHSRKAFPSVATLSRMTKMNRTTVIKATKILESHNILRIEQRHTEEGDLTSNEYFLVDRSDWKMDKSEGVVVQADHGSRSERLRVVVQADTNNTDVEQDSPVHTSCADSDQHLTPDQLIDLYNEKTPDECPAVRVRSPQRKEKARRYLNFFPEQAFWEEVFRQIHVSKFLRGLQRSNGHQSFIADFDWLLTKGQDGTENCAKVYDGKYHD